MKINGYDYQIEISGQGNPTWVFLHGFLGSKADFTKIVPRGTKIYITAYGFAENDATLPAHHFSTDHQVQDLAALFASLQVSSINLVGYSMGARLALAFAIQHPQLVHHLWLESGTAGIINPDARKQRQLADQTRATQIEQQGLVSFVNHWETLPLFNSQQHVSKSQQQFMHQQRINHNPINMANSLRYFGTGTMPNCWNQLSQLKIPITLITGAQDLKFTKLNQKMKALLPNADHVLVADAGHNVHFEKSAHFTSLLNQEKLHEN
ncbi:2-succinyl-6-hydroxy-2,4-cyclohexadiene-1-carboxylate synthase [Fructilactobacillus frigidiflavus]|uniref:2-succinyl-6-hydroxy-2, 4-cyclohexadiene-1-carboxylate synthase n=1 Tax=Fructilactobacillus frigidiflavus TaxID=3242688 RepID=UPI0037581491